MKKLVKSHFSFKKSTMLSTPKRIVYRLFYEHHFLGYVNKYGDGIRFVSCLSCLPNWELSDRDSLISHVQNSYLYDIDFRTFINCSSPHD